MVTKKSQGPPRRSCYKGCEGHTLNGNQPNQKAEAIKDTAKTTSIGGKPDDKGEMKAMKEATPNNPRLAGTNAICGELPSMDFSIGTALFLIFSSYFSDAVTRNYTTELSVPNGNPWGIWGDIDFCDKGYADGFSLRVQLKDEYLDDTSMNAIRLHCTDGSIIQSTVGAWGKWTKAEMCAEGRLISFSLRVVEPLGPVTDDTSADNIKFTCENGDVLTGYSTDWGTYGPWSAPCAKGAICGVQTRIDSEKSGDMTGLNDVKFYCCD
ncbi:vitelline membrane outer layer protein 1-like [Lacerta agilis]|uniref:vitelline membrane outer layer protein 1-like n=1 Tax=Lacerta agilis TaxID=80427 RepID=UPI00141911F6|nr:vitelline membrane outer layer protein 1-like [Lacerta agilis]